MSFQIHDYVLKRHDIRFEKDVNLEIVYKIYFHRETNCSYYVINNVVNIYNYYDILIRADDFVFYFLYRYKRNHLSDLQFRNIF